MHDVRSFRLSWPPTVNHRMSVNRRSGRMYTTGQYREWMASNLKELGNQEDTIKRPVMVDIGLEAPTRRRYDIDNRIKPILDLLTKARVIDDDSLVDRIECHRMEPCKPGRALVRVFEI